MNENELKEELFEKIKILNETIWEHSTHKLKIENWLDNYQNDKEKLHALYLLSQFMYFGGSQMRHLLRILFEDLYKYRVVESIRLNNNDTLDNRIITEIFNKELRKTRFLGIGNPSESGPHLLYFFRQENKLPKSLFIHAHEIFDRYGSNNPTLANSDIMHYVFIDDFCGSGVQAQRYSNSIVSYLKNLCSDCQVDYLILFSTKSGKDLVTKNTKFDYVDAVFELDDSFKCFESDSRYFKDCPDVIEKKYLEDLCKSYGEKLMYSICKLEGIPTKDLTSCAKYNSLGFKRTIIVSFST